MVQVRDVCGRLWIHPKDVLWDSEKEDGKRYDGRRTQVDGPYHCVGVSRSAVVSRRRVSSCRKWSSPGLWVKGARTLVVCSRRCASTSDYLLREGLGGIVVPVEGSVRRGGGHDGWGFDVTDRRLYRRRTGLLFEAFNS